MAEGSWRGAGRCSAITGALQIVYDHILGGGGVLLRILGGGVPPGYPNSDPISDQKMSFFTPAFRPGLEEIMSSRLDWNTNKSDFLIRPILFLSYSFGIKRINTFIHSRSSLENHTRFRTKMGKASTLFQTKTAQKPYPLGRHTPIWLIQGSSLDWISAELFLEQ